MPDAIAALGQVLSRDMARMNLHAGNMANLNTAGFQARVAGRDFSAQTGLSSVQGTNIQDAASLTRQGKLSATGKPLDIAIIGDGWLVEKSQDGALFLTRNGRLRVNNEGILVSALGHRILGAQGEIFAGTEARHRINAAGALLAGEEIAGQLLITALPADAQRLPDGRYAIWLVPPALSDARVAAGVIEFANVDLAHEMTQLMMISRHLESTQKALQLYDSAITTGINQIGKE